MSQEDNCIQAEVYWGSMNGNSIWDIYAVGRIPLVSSTNSPFRKEIINKITITTLPYTVAAFIYFDSGMEYVENVKRYYGSSAHSADGESPDVPQS